MIDKILSATWIGLENSGFFFLCLAFFKAKRDKKAILFSTIALIIFSLFVSYTVSIFSFRFALTITIYTLYARYITDGRILPIVFISVISLIVGSVLDAVVGYGYCILADLSMAELTSRETTYTVVVTTSKLLDVTILWMVYRLRGQKNFLGVQNKYFFLSLLFPATSYCALFIFFNALKYYEDASNGIILLSIVLALANVGVLYLINLIEKESKKETELVLLKQQIDMQSQSYKALELNYRTQRKVTHEFERHLQTLRNLMDQKENAAAYEYIQQLQRNRSLRIVSINSKHPVIDAILNQKHQLALESNINIQIEVNNLSKVNIQTDKLVVLLSNLLDNAIEACQRKDEHKEIHCKLILEDSLYIAVRNTSRPVQILDGMIVTSKGSVDEHGYGVPAVCFVLGELQAEYTFDYSDGWFRFVAEIPIK